MYLPPGRVSTWTINEQLNSVKKTEVYEDYTNDLTEHSVALMEYNKLHTKYEKELAVECRKKYRNYWNRK